MYSKREKRGYTQRQTFLIILPGNGRKYELHATAGEGRYMKAPGHARSKSPPSIGSLTHYLENPGNWADDLALPVREDGALTESFRWNILTPD
jgi:hypothetical protein